MIPSIDYFFIWKLILVSVFIIGSLAGVLTCHKNGVTLSKNHVEMIYKPSMLNAVSLNLSKTFILVQGCAAMTFSTISQPTSFMKMYSPFPKNIYTQFHNLFLKNVKIVTHGWQVLP